jgi:hypothetical protein
VLEVIKNLGGVHRKKLYRARSSAGILPAVPWASRPRLRRAGRPEPALNEA